MAGVPSPTEPGPARRGHYALLALFVALALTVAALTYSYLSAETDGIKREAHEELSLIADMKVKQIASFLEDRKGALRVLQENQMNLAALERRLKGASSPGERSRLQVWLEAMQRNRRFSAIVLADPHGQVALSIGQMIAGAEEIAAFVRQTGAHDEVTLRDFHRHPVTGAVRLGLGVPLRRLEGGAPFGVLLVSIDPADSLFPALEQWPTASATGEALLVRQDADGVVVLNAMRRWREAAMSVRVPLARSHVAAVRAAAGAAGAVDGFNYRGIPVFAVARPVPDTPWSLVVELDQAEVQEQLARRFFPAGLAAISLVLAAAAALAWLWRHQQARFYQDLYRAEVERRALTDHYGYLSRFANDIILLMDNAGRIVEANDRAMEAYGYSRAELLRMTAPDLWYPSEAQRMAEYWKEISQSGSRIYETIHRRRDGAPMPVEVSSRAVEVEGGVFRQNIIRDITERQAMHARLLQSEERFRKVVENAPEAIVVESGLSLQYLNPVAARLLGARSAAEMQGRSLLDFVPPEERDTVAEYSRRAAEGAPVSPVERRLVGADGRVFPAELSAAPIEYDQGPAALVFFRDIAGRKRAEIERAQLEAQLLQSQKMESIGRLAGGVAHDFNNYLTVINGYCEQLCGEVAPGDPIRGPLEEIRAAGERAAALTSQLLAFSRKQTVDFKPISLSAVVTDSERMLRALLGEDIEIIMRLDPQAAAVMGDWSQLHQVLLNLAVNARDAMPGGGALMIETSSVSVGEARTAAHPEARPGRYALLTVSDSGVGMSAETMQKIFEPFFTTKEDGRGTGLGLATAYGIARQTGGWIEAESAPGRGARFRVYLPQMEGGAPARSPAAPGPADSRGGETILVVEDRPDVRRLALAILGQRGYRLLEAASGAEALEVAARFDGPIDLLLTDVVMPGMNGRDLAARLRAARPALKALYTSGYASPSANTQEAEDESAAFLGKPFTAAQLTSMVRNVLGSDS